jgi:hypothetical protein
MAMLLTRSPSLACAPCQRLAAPLSSAPEASYPHGRPGWGSLLQIPLNQLNIDII